MAPRLDLVGVIVADMARTLDFYRLLGLEFAPDAAALPHVEATLPGGLRLAWDTEAGVKNFDAGWSAPQGGARMSLAFLCDDPAEVDRMHATMIAAGHRSYHDPWDAFWGQRYATVLDPDDNPVDLFAPLAATA